MKIYIYSKCDTCRKALKFLDAKKLSYEAIPIRETPPTKAELKKMLALQAGDLKKLFNASGLDYKKLKMKDKISTMTPDAAIELLSQNGNLIKRPFLLKGNVGCVGFKEEIWRKIF